MLHRLLKNSRTYILLLILLGCCLFVSSGRSARLSADYDINLINLSYGVSFSTIEEFLDWYKGWQYQWLVSDLGIIVLLPILVILFPSMGSPETTVPLVMGRKRRHIFFAGLLCYYLTVAGLWLCCFLGQMALCFVSLAPQFPISYYLRTMGLALYLHLGFGGLSLALALLPKNRFAGIVLSFVCMALLSTAKNSGLFAGTFLKELLPRNGRRLDMWLWQVDAAPTPGQLAAALLFPVVTTALACLIGLVQFHRRDIC
jgi:hypothetical protein